MARQTQNKNNVLFIYPCLFKVTGLPTGIASLSAVLRENNYQVRIFDTVFYNVDGRDENKIRSGLNMMKKIVNEDQHWNIKTTDIKKDLISFIRNYKPKIVGISILESNYEMSLVLTRLIKYYFKDIVIVAGGVFPTLSPDLVIKESSIDIVCLGEGETALLKLCNSIRDDKDYSNIAGLWVKNRGEIYKNNQGKIHDINELPYPDFMGFAEELFYKPMRGKLYKMVTIETSRGCPYDCTYCTAPKLKDFFRKNNSGSYYRRINVEKVIEQIYYQIEKHSPEFIYFSSEIFLAMNKKDFDMFIKEYKKIRIPFWFQTRFETIKEEHIKALKEIGMFWLTFGLEHGNEEFRKKILNRIYLNKLVFEVIGLLKKYNVGAALNNMLGFPFENRKLIFDTIQLNKELFEINNKLEFNVWMFAPYSGCKLYDLCKQKGLLPDKNYVNDTTLSESSLNFPKEYKEELKRLIKTFNLYVKLPKKYYPKIKVAEQSDKEGALMFEHLSQVLSEDTF